MSAPNGSYFCYSYVLFKSGSWGRLLGQFIIGFGDSYNNLSSTVFRDHLILEPKWYLLKIIFFLPLVICSALTAAQCHQWCTWPGKEHWKSGRDRDMSSFCTSKFLWLWKWWIGPIFYTELWHIKYWPWCLKWSGIQISWVEGGDRVAEVFVVCSVVATQLLKLKQRKRKCCRFFSNQKKSFVLEHYPAIYVALQDIRGGLEQ